MFHKPAVEDAEPVIAHPPPPPPPVPPTAPEPLPPPEPPPPPIAVKVTEHVLLASKVMVHVVLVPQWEQSPPHLAKVKPGSGSAVSLRFCGLEKVSYT